MREKYYDLYGRNMDKDIKKYVNGNLLKRNIKINAKTELLKSLLNYWFFKDYLKRPFDPVKYAVLINSVISNKDDSLIIERLLNQRSKEQRRGIFELKFRGLSDSRRRKKGAISLIIGYITDFEKAYVDTLLIEV